ncbi:hypothetical protein THAOC_07987, partial [Thalassiosira oceanica]
GVARGPVRGVLPDPPRGRGPPRRGPAGRDGPVPPVGGVEDTTGHVRGVRRLRRPGPDGRDSRHEDQGGLAEEPPHPHRGVLARRHEGTAGHGQRGRAARLVHRGATGRRRREEGGGQGVRQEGAGTVAAHRTLDHERGERFLREGEQLCLMWKK